MLAPVAFFVMRVVALTGRRPPILPPLEQLILVLLRREKSFSQNFREVFRSFREVFRSFRKVSEAFGHVQTHSDPFGPAGTRLDAFGCIRKRLDVFRKVQIF